MKLKMELNPQYGHMEIKTKMTQGKKFFTYQGEHVIFRSPNVILVVKGTNPGINLRLNDNGFDLIILAPLTISFP